jgi:N-acetylmuramoyl-L-alanine amidase
MVMCVAALALGAARGVMAQSLDAQADALSGDHPPAMARSAARIARPPGAVGVRFGGENGVTRVVVDLASAPTRRITATPLGDHVVILAGDVAPDGVKEGPGKGLVTHWRISPSDGGARISLDLAAGAVITRRFLIPPSGEVTVWRYVLDLGAGDILAILDAPADSVVPTALPGSTHRAALSTPREAPTAALAPPTESLAKPRLPASPHLVPVSASEPEPRLAPGQRKIIVIDAGHGGHDVGAQSLVRNEKDINLAAALDLKTRLERTGRYRVVMTRDSDVFIPLEERVRIARRAKADLFISLHSDSAGADPTPHGASIYTVSDRGVTRVHDVMGPQDSLLRGGDKRTNPAVSQILLDLTQRSTRNRSGEFAGMLLDHLSGSVDLLPRSQRDANYFVLLAPDVPAVLLEMGFITNPSDELRLTDPDKRRQMMDRVGDAIEDYFAPRAQMASR